MTARSTEPRFVGERLNIGFGGLVCGRGGRTTNPAILPFAVNSLKSWRRCYAASVMLG
jgi:hypothetical protein